MKPLTLVLCAAFLVLGDAQAQQYHLGPAESPGSPQDLSLDEALNLAGSASDALKVARAGILRARGSQLQARSQYFPQVTGSASYTRTIESQFANTGTGGGVLSEAGFGAPNQYDLGLDVSLNLFDWGNTWAQNAGANASRRAADIELTAQQAQLILDVTERYYDAALADVLVAIADSSLAQSARVLRHTEEARAVGSQSGYELLRAQVTHGNQVPPLIQRRNQRDIAYYRLKQLLDIPLDQPLRLTTSVDVGGTGGGSLAELTRGHGLTPDTIATNRAAVRQQLETLRQQEATARATRAQRYPALSLVSSYGRVAYPQSGVPTSLSEYRTNWTVGVSVSVPLITFGRLRGQERSARANVDEARAQLNQRREEAALDARQTLLDLDEAEVTFVASANTALQAERAYQIAEVRFQEGIETQTELSDVRISLAESRSNRAQAGRDLQVARVRLALIRDLPLQTQSTPTLAAESGTQ